MCVSMTAAAVARGPRAALVRCRWAARIHDDRVPVAHEHIGQRPFAHPVDLDYMLDGAVGDRRRGR